MAKYFKKVSSFEDLKKQFKELPFNEAARAEVLRMRNEILEAANKNGM